ncbi:class I adenylate-forming enzyme family protein [Nocardia niigatensis]|uniref:class I adenylate-forming enzyme family protein n=1 Tax=Nocardia niigatensis TaxID=209249 RepID=UPI0003175F1C|nr:class I adenylate-forming enzyme family protein [Nocardia niigatensis]
MTNAVDLQALAAQVVGKLTGPGGSFEMTVEPVLGAPLPVFKHRRRSLLELLEASRELGDLEYLVSGRTRYTFAEHYAAAGALAAALAERYGVGKGDRIGILAANTPEWVLTFWAAQRLGAIPVGYNAWWVPREIAYGLEHTSPKVVIADAKRAAPAAETGTGIPVLTIETDLPALIAEFAGGHPSTAVSEDDPAIILYTSGTTGRPKGVVHSQQNLVAVVDYHRFMDALAAGFLGRTWDGAPAARRYLATMPLFHIASLHNLAIPRLATGDAVVFPVSGEFDAESLLRLVETEQVTNWAAVPTLASRILGVDISKYDLSSLTAFSLNSAPSSPVLVQRLRERFPVALQGLTTSYGCTESGTAATVATPPELAADTETVGRAVVGVAVEVRDLEGKPAPDGEEGEICIRSPYVMLGYWNNTDATNAAIDENRWLRTGDYGTLREGKLYISGRRSDLILRGGENVYPQEIENALDEHPLVRESAVIGVPHEDLGQSVAAIVVVDDPEQLSEDELRDHVARRLAYFKVPAHWLVTADPLPRNATGKVLRRDLPRAFRSVTG